MDSDDRPALADPADLADLERAELALQAAQLASDVDALDALLHPDLTFVGPDGSLSSKADGRMRYTRTWAQGPAGWRVVAAHAGFLA